MQADHAALTAHLTQLQADNASNPDPVVIILRMDAGFGTGENLAWVIELGYIVYTKAHNAQVAASLLAQLEPGARWTPVGRNAELLGRGQQQVTNCPYPLTVAVERFHTPEQVSGGDGSVIRAIKRLAKPEQRRSEMTAVRSVPSCSREGIAE